MNFEFSNSRGSFRKWTCVLLAILISFSCFQLSAPVIAAYASNLVTGGNVTAGNVTSGNVTGGNVTDGNLKLESCNGVFLALNKSGTEYYVYKVGYKVGSDIFGSDIFIDIPSSYNGKPVTGIGNSAFERSRVEYVTLPDSIKYIGNMAFRYCFSLTSITIPDSVTSIGDSAFSYCCNLESVTIPDSVTSIGSSAFDECRSLTSITIPDSVTSIGDSAFFDCRSLTSITVDSANKSYSSVDGVLFNKTQTEVIQYPMGKTSTSYTIPDSVTSIGRVAFRDCSSLTNITIPDSVTSIGDSAFSYCRSLTSITIPDSVTSIGGGTFWYCTSLTSITIPEGVTSIGNEAFFVCSSLKDVYYGGTEADWANIAIGSLNNDLTNATIHYHEHSYNGEWIVDIEPTCTEAGSKHKECTVCKTVLETTAISATGHTEVKYEAVAATCTQTGKTEGKHCSVCNAVIVAQLTIPAKGHTTVKDTAVAATCTTAGKTEGSHCSVCNTVIVAQQTVPAKGHTASATKYDAVKRLEYKECTVCKVVLESKYIPLATTTITSCYNEVNGVQLKWNAVADAAKYDIYRKLPTESTWTKLTTVSTLAYQDTNVTGNTIYQYKIKAVDQYGNQSDYSAQRECRFIATPKLKSISNTVGGINISWEKVAGATSYRIYRRGAGTNYWYYLGDVSSTQNTFFDKESSLVKSGNYYRYTVRASYSGKDSAGKDYLIYSGFDTNGLYIKYMASPKLTSISNATNGLQITWSAVAGVTNGYRVYRRGAGSTYWTYLGTVKTTSYTDTAVKNKSGEYFRYTVIADGGKYSAFDTTGLYLKRLANPTLKSATSAKAGITVKWNAVAGTTGYYVYRKTANSGWTRIASVGGTNNTTYLDKTAQKGVTYVYTVRAVYGSTTSYFNSGISCKDLY